MTDLVPEVFMVERRKVGKRRKFPTDEKERIVRETYEPGASVSKVARRHDINPSMLFKWRRQFEEGALTALGAGEDVVPASEAKRLKAEIRELQRMLGKKTMQVEILKEAIKIAEEKKLISRLTLPKLPEDDL